MNPAPSQPVPDSHYFDLDMPDTSEQEFSASLETASQRTHFELDASEPSTRMTETSPAGPDSNLSIGHNHSPDPDADAGQPEQHDTDAEADPDWRQQVSAKVSSYKTRIRHQPRYPSLQLRFDQAPYRPSQRPDFLPAAEQSFSQSIAAEITALRPEPISASEPAPILLQATARVLEFPRPAALPFNPDELAEPMLDRPRIVEAPELVPPGPALGGILIEPAPQPDPERRPGFDVPLSSAPLGQRLWAGTIDLLLLAIAVAAFGYIFFRITGALLPLKNAAEFGAGLLAVLWPVYEYAFLVFTETTPGLRLAHLAIKRFDGTPPPRSLRRWRVLACILSAASLGLGYAWCFLDEDQLTWHDRITRTHLAPKGPAHDTRIPSA